MFSVGIQARETTRKSEGSAVFILNSNKAVGVDEKRGLQRAGE